VERTVFNEFAFQACSRFFQEGRQLSILSNTTIRWNYTNGQINKPADSNYFNKIKYTLAGDVTSMGNGSCAYAFTNDDDDEHSPWNTNLKKPGHICEYNGTARVMFWEYFKDKRVYLANALGMALDPTAERNGTWDGAE
jgi:hypothetical protein